MTASIDTFAGLSDGDLAALANALRSGRLPLPASAAVVARISGESNAANLTKGLQAACDLGMNAEQIAWALDLCLQSRIGQSTADGKVELVLTGSDASKVTARDTAAIIHELFSSATQSVLIVGYAVYAGNRVFKSLAKRMEEFPALKVQILLEANAADDWDQEVRSFVAVFQRYNWPKDSPLPEVYLHRRTKEGPCLHAKAAVIDEAITLISSANFTEAAHLKNFEAGVLVRSTSLSRQVTLHFDALITKKVVLQVL